MKAKEYVARLDAVVMDSEKHKQELIQVYKDLITEIITLAEVRQVSSKSGISACIREIDQKAQAIARKHLSKDGLPILEPNWFMKMLWDVAKGHNSDSFEFLKLMNTIKAASYVRIML